MLYKNKSIISYGEMKERLINDFAMDEVMAGNNIAKAIPTSSKLTLINIPCPTTLHIVKKM